MALMQEEALASGVESIADEHLLELLGGAAASRLTVERAHRASAAELATQLSPRGALRLAAAFELGRRVDSQPFRRGESLGSSADVVARLGRRLRERAVEELHVLGLDGKHRLHVHIVAATGGDNVVFANPRDVFRRLLRDGAESFILVHNHPSGDATPSDADAHLTAAMADAGERLGLPLVDHVIVARDGHFSFCEQGHESLRK
jgi:DNA repair protein RadC